MAMQAGFWAMFAAIVAYQTALLLERGFSNSEAGLMTAVRCLAGIVFQPLLGGFADRHPRLPLKHIVTVSMALSLVAGVWYWISPGMGLWETTLVWVVIGGLEVSSYPLMDAMAVQFINEGVPIRYSLGRGIGSLAYAVVCVVLGFQAGRLGLESTLVTLEMERQLLNAAVDRFGREAHIRRGEGERVVVSAEVEVSPTFLGWVISFGGGMRILAPDSVCRQMADLCRANLAQYTADT